MVLEGRLDCILEWQAQACITREHVCQYIHDILEVVSMGPAAQHDHWASQVQSTTVTVQWGLGDALLVVKFAIQGLAMWSWRLVTGSLPAAPAIQQLTMRLDNVLMLPCARMAAAAGVAAWCRGGESGR